MVDKQPQHWDSQLAAIRAQLYRIDQAIRGDGEKSPGLCMRMDRLERCEAVRGRIMWATAMGVLMLLLNRFWSFLS